jgi:hypothetical protein
LGYFYFLCPYSFAAENLLVYQGLLYRLVDKTLYDKGKANYRSGMEGSNEESKIMANYIEFTEEQQVEFSQWLSMRPPEIQAMVVKFPPNKLYRLKSSGSRVTIISYETDNTVTVAISGRFNRVMFERNVFGIALEDLEECDLPSEDEDLGAMLTDENEIKAFIDKTRPAVLRARNYEKN